MTQLSFNDLPKSSDIYEGIAPHIVEAFQKYNESHPDIYSLFRLFSLQLKASGIYHYGAKAIMERIRWHFEVERKSGEFKINNSYASCYARLLMNQDPYFKNFFSTRSHAVLQAA